MKKAIVFLTLLAIGLAGLGYVLSQSSGHTAEDAYTFDHIQYGKIQDVVNALGPLQPRDVLTISSTVPGQVTAINYDVNNEVEEGEVLVQLEDRPAQHKLEEAEAACKQAEAACSVAVASADEAEVALDIAKLTQKRVHNLPPAQKSSIDDEKVDLEVKRWEATRHAAALNWRKAP